jgi:3-oxoacyl-[acyl-carrier protein] reductase
MDPDRWWRVVEVNLKGMATLTRAALPALRHSPDPSVVLVSSVVGIIGHAGDTAYATAKAAMIGFARSLAKESRRDGVRVNVLAPGFIDTDMTAAIRETARRNIARATVLRRFGSVEEIGRAAVFLSEDATYCTGSVLAADGGWSI